MKKRFFLNITVLLMITQILFSQETDSLSFHPDKKSHWVDSVFNSLSLKEQIAQLMMIRTYSNKNKKYYEETERLVKEYNLGGLCFFQGGPVTQAKLTNSYQNIAKTPLLIAIDAEWGLGMRLDSTFSFPFQMTLGASVDDELIYNMGVEIGRQLKLLGIHINFAPVVDINNNASNPVINSRSFGENKINVAKKSIAYMEGLQSEGIIATAKHFPGHGDTDSDSHYTLPLIKHSKSRLDSVELYPFKQLFKNDLKAVMVAHLFIPSLDSTLNTPTTLSKNVVSGLLKNDLGFKGLVITDALDMKGVTSHYKPGEIEVKAFQAGNDILLLPQDIKIAIESIRNAVENGEINKSEVEKRCKKILLSKYDAGLYNYKPAVVDSLYYKINGINNELLERQAYESAQVLVQNNDDLIPLRRLDTLKIASLSLGSAEITPFQNMLSNYSIVDHYTAIKNLSEKQSKILIKKLSSYNLIIAALHNTNIFPGKNFGISQQHISIVKQLADSLNLVLVMFSSPYSLDLFDDTEKINSILLAHQDKKVSNEIAAQIVMGSIGAQGTLPVSGSEKFVTGASITTNSIQRLKYTIPEEVGICSQKLLQIDSIVLENIKDKAIPGCQILVAKEGKVIYSKAFGYHTYKKGHFVKNNDLYDIASITKIAATTLSIMKLYDQRKLDIDHKLVWYLPYLDGSNKENIIIRELMAHQSGLKAWIPFYINTLDNRKPDKIIYSSNLNEKHTVKVANKLYIKSSYAFTLYDSILYSDLRKKRDYKYSDLGFYLLKQSIENLTNKPLDQYVNQTFYKPLGLQYTLFNPLDKFKLQQIVPTEKDNYFRRQLVHGYVHDPGAAMLGGVSGHAGLFSTANDLAIIMQMFLQGGEYGGQRYLRSSTVYQFTKQQFPLNDNRRAIGFDKPDVQEPDRGPTCESASPLSFGHSGFTGAYAWADPEYNLIYIFLSNRVHPTSNNTKLIRNNTRTKIHQVVYDAIDKEEKNPIPDNEIGSLPFNKN